jgi:hypothetical protein
VRSIMPKARWYHLAALVLATATGCANLETRKVPLADRLNGADDKYKGFRYYLSRPYMVVSRRVCVGQQIVVGKLMQNEDKELFLETIDPEGGRQYLTMRGEDRTKNVATDESLVYLTYPPRPAETPSTGTATKPPASGAGQGGGSPDVVLQPPPPSKPGSDQKKEADINIPPRTRDQIVQTLTDTAPAPPVGAKADDTTPPPFQFVMLPDFEEQLAIKDCNFAAKGKYELKFADGWQLRSVGGAWDATEVAVRALQVLSDAVSATAAVRQEQLNKLPVVKRKTDLADRTKGTQVIAVLVWGTYVEPGVYRLLKSSEKQAPPAVPDGGPDCPVAGILTDLGLPTVRDVQTYLLSP